MFTNRSAISIIDLQKFVADEVSLLTQSNNLFTAFDVTNKLRGEHQDLEIGHKEVRMIVDSMYKIGQMGQDYTRTSTVMQNGQSAFVFHNITDAPTNHPFAEKPTVTDSDDSDPDPATAVLVGLVGHDVVEVTKESRLNIPQKLLRNVDMHPFDDVYLNINDNSNTVSLNRYVVTDIPLKVNADGAVRISQSHLVKKFGKVSQFYKVYQADGSKSILIEAV